MTHCYRHLSAEDRAAIMLMGHHYSIRTVVHQLRRAPSAVSLVRHTGRPDMAYDNSLIGYLA